MTPSVHFIDSEMKSADPISGPYDNNSDAFATGFSSNRRSKSAGWTNSSRLLERRDRLRSSAAFTVDIQPLDIDLQPVNESQQGTILNYSSQGVCLEMEQVLAEPYVEVSWIDLRQKFHTATIRLRWCRSLGHNSFLSGGRVVCMG